MLPVLKHHLWRRVRAAYYAFALDRLPLGATLGRFVSEWETAQGFGDSPKAKPTWDAEYGDGRWTYMGQQHELTRYWTLIGYMHSLGRGREYLDVGCGEGLLFERFKPLDYQRFVGVDISDVAIEKLRRYNDRRTSFLSADGDVYEPDGYFDVIVFNESLYYLRAPVRSLERYAQSLKSDGCMIISTYTASRRSLAVLRDAKRTFKVLDEAKTTQGQNTWLCTVLKR
ncbi:class I SAM-dependent methyltransferase [Nitrobacter sp. TKz-YC01]|uniref:class I SAM-dependent methyltransferase n=1 Tax=Nitrobacter sp. TKz-YC01 TaxID=3398703 RepID=UPI003A1020C2